MSAARKILIVIVSVALFYLGYYLYSRRNKPDYFDIQNDALGAARNANRDYTFLLTNGTSISLFSSFNPAVLESDNTFKPWIVYSDPDFSEKRRAENKENAEWLIQTFDDIVVEVAKSVRLPKVLIYCVMLVEVGTQARIANWSKAKFDQLVQTNPSGATGPMQVKPITATETIQIAINKGLISDYHTIILRDTLGPVRFAELLVRETPKSRYFKDNKIIGYDGRPQELTNDKMNIMIGALKILNLIDNYGEKNLHQVYYSYNQGDRTALARGLTRYSDASEFARNSSGEGKKYIERILGKNGALDILINDLRIFE